MLHVFAGYNKGLPVISGISVNDGNSASKNHSRIDVSDSSQLSLFSPGQKKCLLADDTVTHADARRGDTVFAGVCLSVYPHCPISAVIVLSKNN